MRSRTVEAGLQALAGLAILLGLAVSALAQPAAAQALVSLTPTTVTYDTGVRKATISRDILANLPISGEYQWVAQDLAMVVPPGFAPPPLVSDSLFMALDSLEARIEQGRLTYEQQVAAYEAQIGTLQSEVARLSQELENAGGATAEQIAELQGRVDELRRGMNQTLNRIRDILRSLE